MADLILLLALPSMIPLVSAFSICWNMQIVYWWTGFFFRTKNKTAVWYKRIWKHSTIITYHLKQPWLIIIMHTSNCIYIMIIMFSLYKFFSFWYIFKSPPNEDIKYENPLLLSLSLSCTGRWEWENCYCYYGVRISVQYVYETCFVALCVRKEITLPTPVYTRQIITETVLCQQHEVNQVSRGPWMPAVCHQGIRSGGNEQASGGVCCKLQWGPLGSGVSEWVS